MPVQRFTSQVVKDGTRRFQLCAERGWSRRKTVFVNSVIDKAICWVPSIFLFDLTGENTAGIFREKWNVYEMWA